VRLVPTSDARAESVRFSEVLAALSFALDLSEGHPAGHSLRTCLIGMELANRLGLPLNDRRDLYPEILERAGLRLDERLRRHVNRRTGRRAGEFFEDVLIARV